MRVINHLHKQIIPEGLLLAGRGSQLWIPAFAEMTILFFLFSFFAFAGETEKIFPASDKPHAPSEKLKVHGTRPGDLPGKENRSQDKPAGKMFPGEKMKFKITCLGMTVGEAESEVGKLVKVNGRDAYPVEISIRSRPVLEWIYKVRDTHHTSIDAEHFYSLKYEKEISEGRYQTHKMTEYDQEKHTGKFYSFKDHSRKEMLIAKNAQDQISCGYWIRLQDVKPGSKITIPVNADEKNWDLEVVTHGIQEMKIDGVGTFRAVEVEPLIFFEGFFVRRGKVRGWMSMDERRIPLVMKVKIPVLGDITATLVQYDPG